MRAFIIPIILFALAGSVAGAPGTCFTRPQTSTRHALFPPLSPPHRPTFSLVVKDVNKKTGAVLYKATYLNTATSRTRATFDGDFNVYTGATVSTIHTVASQLSQSHGSIRRHCTFPSGGK